MPVLSMLSTILVAVPAFMRVEPLTTSGPTTGVMLTSERVASSGSRLQLRPTVKAPDAAGVVERTDHVGRATAGGDADDDVGRTGRCRFFRSSIASAGKSSAPSTERVSAA